MWSDFIMYLEERNNKFHILPVNKVVVNHSVLHQRFGTALMEGMTLYGGKLLGSRDKQKI